MFACSSHVAQPRANGEGKKRQAGESSGKQKELPLISSMTRRVVDAPAIALRSVETPAECLDWMMKASGSKGAYIAACIGKSEGYVSKLRAGLKPIPEKLVTPLCVATGSNLLAKFLARLELEDESTARAARAISAMRSAA